MALSDTAIRAVKHGPKPIKLFDANGLFLLVQPSGGKLWRLKYRFQGKEKKLGLGQYPEITLKEARRRRDEARARLALGFDPSAERSDAKLQARLNVASSFELVGNEYPQQEGRG